MHTYTAAVLNCIYDSSYLDDVCVTLFVRLNDDRFWLVQGWFSVFTPIELTSAVRLWSALVNCNISVLL